MRVIGVAGYSGSGKTYISQCLKTWCEKHDYIVHLISFDSVKEKNLSRKKKHQTVQDELQDTLTALFVKEKEHYSTLCKWELECEFKETIVIIDGVSFLDDIKFIHLFNGDVIFVDASQRLDIPTLQTAREHLANAVTFGKYPLGMFSKIINNNLSKTALDRSLSRVLPNLVG